MAGVSTHDKAGEPRTEKDLELLAKARSDKQCHKRAKSNPSNPPTPSSRRPSPRLGQKPLPDIRSLKSDAKLLANGPPLQFPLPTNAISHHDHNIFTLHTIAAASQRNFCLSIRGRSSYLKFSMFCSQNHSRNGAERCPFRITVGRATLKAPWRCTATEGEHRGHEVRADDEEGYLLEGAARRLRDEGRGSSESDVDALEVEMSESSDEDAIAGSSAVSRPWAVIV